MSVAAPRVLELAEFKPLALAPEELSAELAATIRLRYSNQIAIEQP